MLAKAVTTRSVEERDLIWPRAVSRYSNRGTLDNLLQLTLNFRLAIRRPRERGGLARRRRRR